MDRIRKELDEVRNLKEELKREVDAVRREKEESHQRRAEERRTRRRPRPPKPPKPPRVARIDLDLEDLTDSLENMMDGLGHQIEMSLRSVEGLKVPGIRIHKGRRRSKKRDEQQAMIESIAPERVAQIVGPLGSEERLKILDYLKTGGKSFNDIENYTGKTGSSLTHHLNPLIEAGYVVKGEVRGTYYVTVEGRLAYRLAQWLTHRVETQRAHAGKNGGSEGEVEVEFDDDDSQGSYSYDFTTDDEIEKMEDAKEHLNDLAEQLEEQREEMEEQREKLEEQREDLEEQREEMEEDMDDTDDLDDLDWDD